MPRPLSALSLVALAATVSTVTAGALVADRPTAEAEAEAWAGLVGGDPADVEVGQRMVVVLTAPSLADRVRRAGGRADDRQHRSWTRAAASAQKLFVSQMVLQGARVQPEFTFTRVLNGFSAPLDPSAIALLERSPEVEGIYPVRASFPAAVGSRLLEAGEALSQPVGLPGFDGRGVTIALLDTGVDRAQPALSGRLLEGIDVVGDSRFAQAAARPDDGSQLERHATQLAGILAAAAGRGGVQGVASAASILPIRVAGWQRDATGGWAVYGRTDQLIAGLERAVDPNGDGVAHDAARIALVGVAERFAAFSSGPLARAAAGALALDTLVVAPAGNEGPKGPGFGSIAGPGGAPAALTVGAVDLRMGHQRARLVVRTGLNVLVDRVVPLAGVLAPEETLRLRVASPRLVAPDATPAEQASAIELADFFDDAGFSLVSGKAALVPGGGDTKRLVEDAVRAGAAAVIVYGARVPAGALGADDRVGVPVAGLAVDTARETLAALDGGANVGIALGAADPAYNPSVRRVASFSSRGLAFDGRVKPELTAPGVAVPTTEPGVGEDGVPRVATVNGSSAAAAVVAGAAALLAQARPDVDAATLKSVLVGSARPLEGEPVLAQGAGLIDLGAAASAELAAWPTSLAFGRATSDGWSRRLPVTVRNVSTRALALRVSVERSGFPAADTLVQAGPTRLRLGPGRSVRIQVVARVPQAAEGGPAAEGALVVRPAAGTPLRVPFAVAFGPPRPALLGEVALSEQSFEPSDTKPAVLTVEAGSVRLVGGVEEIEPVARLDVELWTGDGKRIGLIARLRNLLPVRLAFAVTGRDPGGQPLDAGPYRLRLVAVPAGAGRPSVKTLEFSIK